MAESGDAGRGSSAPDTRSEIDRLQSENRELKQRLDRRLAWRKWLALLMVVLTSLSVVGATVAIWAHRTVFDSDQFMETVGPALDEPSFYSALSQKVSSQIIEALDVETKIIAALTEVDAYLTQVTQELVDGLEVGDAGRAILSRLERPSLVGLAGPVTDWVESRVELRTEQFVTSDQFKSRFPDLVRRVHEATIALVRNDVAELPNVYTDGGEVRLNLIPIIAEALRTVADEVREYLPDIDLPDVISNRVDEGRQQLTAAIRERLPEDFGQVTLMSEDSLGEIQAGANRLDRFVWLLAGLAIVFAALTIVVSPTRRRTAMQLSIGVVSGFALSAVALRRLQAGILEEIANPDGDRAARALLGEMFGSLRTSIWIVALAALVVGIGAYLVGRPAWLGRASAGVRRLTEPGAEGSTYDRWVASHSDMLRVAGIVAAVVVLFFTGLDLVPVVVTGALLALYLWMVSASTGRMTGTGADIEETTLDSAKGAPTP